MFETIFITIQVISLTLLLVLGVLSIVDKYDTKYLDSRYCDNSEIMH